MPYRLVNSYLDLGSLPEFNLHRVESSHILATTLVQMFPSLRVRTRRDYCMNLKKNNFVGVISPRRTTVVYKFSLSLLVADIKCVTDGQTETVNDTQMIPCTVHILM